MSDKHLSSQFDADLNAISSKVLEMGGLVESQIITAMQALNRFDVEIADRVIEAEHASEPDGSADRRRVQQHHRASSACRA